jgi:glycosyltransferase involved in cell wall biosynthesis
VAKILWLSDTPHRVSGFGIVTGEICARLAAMGHEILILGWWSAGLRDYRGIRVEPCPVCPNGAAAAVIKLSREFQPDYLISLGDVPWLSYIASPTILKVFSQIGIRWIIYYPVDGALPNGCLPDAWVRTISEADVAVTISQYGRLVSAKAEIVASVIPHGCDTSLFCPARSKAAAKRRYGYEGKFVVLSDVRNHRRKLIPRALDIVRALADRGVDFVYHLHTNIIPEEDKDYYRYCLSSDLHALELAPIIRVSTPKSRSLTMEELADLYSAADVHLLTSYGEGFGLPTLQAASSGVVPIAPANSASAELVGRHGFAIPCEESVTDEFGLVRGFIATERAVDVLLELFAKPHLLRLRSRASRKFALGFSWDRAARLWHDLLKPERETISRRLLSWPPSTASQSEGGKPSWPSQAKANESAARPTGHDAKVLPLPTICIPTRLERVNNDREARASPVVVADPLVAPGLYTLEGIFPGLRIMEMSLLSAVGDWVPWEVLERATLVVVAGHGVRLKADLFCAIQGVNYLGPSFFWPAVAAPSLLLRARRLLTDLALSRYRVLEANRRICHKIGGQVGVVERKALLLDLVGRSTREEG